MLTVNELFSGIGSQRKALERLCIPHEVVGISEIDKNAVASYEAIFGKTYNYGDISKIEKLNYADFWTYSFPCQDISVSGKLAGINKNTRSGLLFQVERLLNVSKQNNELPKYLMLENVKNLIGKKFKKQFDEWLKYLDELGYNNYWQVLNAKDYGIPQNRERVFVISIRKDIDTDDFKFPTAFDNGIRLKDVLEIEVDEKFYISQDKVEKMLSQIENNDSLLHDTCQAKREKYIREYNDFSPTLNSRDYKDPRLINISAIDKSYNDPKSIDVANCITAREDRGIINRLKEGTAVLENKVKQIGNIMDSENWSNPQTGRVYDSDGCSPTLNTMQGGNRQPKILQKSRGFNKGGLHDEAPTISSHSWECNNFITESFVVASRGRNPNNPSDRTPGNPTEQRLESNFSGYANTLTTVQKDNYLYEPYDFRIRKLTPLECWRLMGFDDEDFYKAQKGINDTFHKGKDRANSQLYKQAGNSIVVNVLYYIFKNVFSDYIVSEDKIVENFIQPPIPQTDSSSLAV